MLHLLQEIFEQVIVPEAVWREITLDDASKAGVQELLEASWIERRSVTDVLLVHLLRKDLESERRGQTLPFLLKRLRPT